MKAWGFALPPGNTLQEFSVAGGIVPLAIGAECSDSRGLPLISIASRNRLKKSVFHKMVSNKQSDIF